jgi:HAD superfamily phosphatase
MGDAPDKPDPTGLLRLAEQLCGGDLGAAAAPVAYLGDTVADVLTVVQARQRRPDQRLVSLAVAPPHLHRPERREERRRYEQGLLEAGADRLLQRTDALSGSELLRWTANGG